MSRGKAQALRLQKEEPNAMSSDSDNDIDPVVSHDLLLMFPNAVERMDAIMRRRFGSPQTGAGTVAQALYHGCGHPQPCL